MFAFAVGGACVCRQGKSEIVVVASGIRPGQCSAAGQCGSRRPQICLDLRQDDVRLVELEIERFTRIEQRGTDRDVVAQERLLREHFGIDRLALVVGGSMGAQQTYEWAVRFPDRVLRAAPIAGTAKNTPHDFLFTETLNEQLWSDPGWNGGEYSSHTEVVDGLTRHAHLWGTMGFSTEFWKQQKWAALGFDSMQAFLTDFLEPYFTAMDPNDLLTMAWKWQRGDVSRHTDGALAAALGRITAKTFVMPISEDMFFPVRDCAAEQALIPGSELRVIDDVHGHLGLFAVDPGFIPQVDAALSDLLAGPVDGSRAA